MRTKQTSLDKLAFFILIIFSLGGIGLGTYVIYDMFHKRASWEVIIEGNAPPQHKEDIRKAILYFIRTVKGKIKAKDIQVLLKLDPGIRSIDKIEITPPKRISIKIQLREAASIVHSKKNNKLQEMALDAIVLQDGIKNIEKISSEIPIIYLTDRVSSDNRFKLAKRDIMTSYFSTKESLSFIWQRIAEISIGEDNYLYTIYTSQLRSQIQTNEKFDHILLSKLWALFFYVDKKFKTKWTKIKLNLYNAQIQEL